MRMDTPVANGDPTLAALIPEGVTLAHIIALFQDACPVNGVQLLRARLGATHPVPPVAEFIKYVLAALNRPGSETPPPCLQIECDARPKRLPPNSGSSAAIGDLAAERKSDGHAPVTIENNSSTISDASTPRPVAQIIAYGTNGDGGRSDKPATNIVPPTIANPHSTPATAAAGDEIVIDGRQLLGERRVAEMLGCCPRTLQRWRTEKNPRARR